MNKPKPIIIMWSFAIPCLLLSALLMDGTTMAAKHYVKPDGNDALDGHSLANAWKTIYRADTTVVANDTVLISDGTYYQGGQTRTFYGITYYCVLRPTHGGTAGHPIVYKGNGCRPILRGKYGGSDNQDGTGSITAYMDYPYITLDSLDFRISNCGGVVIDAGHITVKYCRIDSVYMINPSGFGNCGGTVTGNGWAGGESVGDCADISNCEIYRTGPVKAVGSSENNYDGVVFYDGDTVWVHDNYIEGVLGVGIKLKKIYGSSHVITIENNTVTSPGIVGIDLGPAAEGNIDSIVVRNNILYNIATLGGTGADDQTQFGAIVQNDLSNLGYNDTRVWVYNNTIDMYRTEFGYQTGRSVAGNDVHFFNNIIWDHQPTTSIKPIESGLPVASFYTDYNLFYGRTSSDDLFWYPNADNNYHDHTSGTYYTLAEWQANNIAEVTGKDAHSTIANPLFVDGANHNYHLQAGSPALSGGKGGAYPTYLGALGTSGAQDSSIRVGDAPAVIEGVNLVFPITIGTTLASPCVIKYSTANGTAIAPGDYTAVVNGQIAIPAGSVTGTIVIQTIDDAIVEPTETMTITLTNATIGRIAQPTATGMILDNDVPADTTKPVISVVQATSIAASSATVTWTTNELATSQVNYGLTVSYGSSTTLDPAYLTSHSQSLTGLSAGTIYHYRVRSRDAAANEAVGSDFTFTTSPPSADTVNYALGRTAAVSGTYSGYTVTPIADGVILPRNTTATTWASDDGTTVPHWVEIDFGAVRPVNGVRIYWAWNSFQSAWMVSRQYRIQSWNGSAYTDIVTVNIPTATDSLAFTTFSTVSTQRLRIYQPANMGPATYPGINWLTELQIWGPVSDTIPPAAVKNLGVQQ